MQVGNHGDSKTTQAVNQKLELFTDELAHHKVTLAVDNSNMMLKQDVNNVQSFFLLSFPHHFDLVFSFFIINLYILLD